MHYTIPVMPLVISLAAAGLLSLNKSDRTLGRGLQSVLQ
jgi:hypothetical protein